MRHLSDLQSVAYLGLFFALILIQWMFGSSWWGYSLLLLLAINIQVVHHNHAHLGIWKSSRLNALTSLYISVISAVPTAMMNRGHLENHHVHQHGPQDYTRTYRFGGDHNHLWGYLLHPMQAYCALLPIFWKDFWSGLPKRSSFSRDLLMQTLMIVAVWILLLSLDWRKCLWLVLIPQMFGLHWLLGSNYLQHAHCDDESSVNYARNFTGAINWLWLNIGFHTAHHDYPRVHWSQLRKLHATRSHLIDPRLNCPSFVVYVVRTFFLSIFWESCRSQSLRRPA